MKTARILVLVVVIAALSATAGLCWEFTDGHEGWCGNPRNNVICDWLGPPHGWGGHLWLQSTGTDPYQVGPEVHLSAKICRYMSLRMNVNYTTNTTSQVFWRQGGSWYNRDFTLTNTDGTQWVTYNLNMTENPNWTGEIVQLRLDPISPGHGGSPNPSILYDYVRPMYSLDGSVYWGFASDIEGWIFTGNINNYRWEGGYLKGTSATADPYMSNWPGPSISASHNNVVRVRMKTSAGTTAELYWDPWASGYKPFPIVSDNTFREYVINMASHPHWTGMTKFFRLDPTTASGASFEVDYVQIFRDKTAPTGSININSGAAYTTSRNVTLNLSATDLDITQDHPVKKGSGVWQASYRNSGGTWGSWETYGTSKAWTLPSGDGTKTVEVRYRDVAENISSTYSKSIILDTTAPSNPTSASETGGAPNNAWQKSVSNPVFTWSGASDATSGVKGYYWYFGTSSGGNPTTWTTSAGCNPSAVSSGTYYLRVKTEDNAGNQSGIVTLFTFRYDGTAPTNATSASETGGAPNNAWQSTVGNPVFTWSGASDAHSGVKGYYWYFGTSSSGNPTNWTTSAGCSPGTQSSGTYYLRVKTEDNAGNQSGVATLFTFKYDNTPPSTPVVVDDGDYITSTTEIHATWSAADAESGIAEYQYAVSASQSEAGIIAGGGWQSVGTATESTRTGLSLTPGETYYVLVKAKNGAGLWSDIGVSDGVMVCEAPLISAHPTSQSKVEGEPVTFSVTATGTGPLSYQWRKNGTEILNANSATYTIVSVGLADAGDYDCVVSNVCGSATSNIATLTVSESLPIGEVKKNADGAAVSLGNKLVTAVFSDHFYVEEADKSSGIRVVIEPMPEGLDVGDSVIIQGTIRTTDNGERIVEAETVNVSEGQIPEPVALSNKDLGGADYEYNAVTGAGQRGVEDGAGTNNIGLLVKTCGTVTVAGEDYFYIDDGTNAKDFSLFRGVRIRCEGLTKPQSGDYVCVTGISSIMKVGDRFFRSVRSRTDDDIQSVDP